AARLGVRTRRLNRDGADPGRSGLAGGIPAHGIAAVAAVAVVATDCEKLVTGPERAYNAGVPRPCPPVFLPLTHAWASCGHVPRPRQILPSYHLARRRSFDEPSHNQPPA